jgi:soluble lytic murein transglycosylase-like protein
MGPCRRARAVLFPLALCALAAGRPASAQPIVEPPSAATVDAAVDEAAQVVGLPRAWIAQVIAAESAGDPQAVSPAGAMGLMQLMPQTWSMLRRRLGLGANPFDIRENVLAGAAYLRELHDRFGAPGFLAAYNAGPQRYTEHLAGRTRLPRETQAYMARLAPVLGGGSPAAPAVRGWRASPLFPDTVP